MEFYIRKDATNPKIQMKLVDDGRNDRKTINDSLESSKITFNMVDTQTNRQTILNGNARLTIKRQRLNQEIDEYCIMYQFNEGETAIKGRYEGTFTIRLLDSDLNTTSKLIVPIKEKLYINVI